MRRSFLKARRSQVAAAVIAALGSNAATAANVSWIGANGSFWDLATNWSSNPALPGAADDVLLGAFNTTFRSGALTVRSFSGTGVFSVTGGTLTFTDAASSVGGLVMSAGQLSGAANLTVFGASTLSLAAMSGNGTSTFLGDTAITGTGLRLDGGRIFNNEGTVTQTNANVDLNSRNLGLAEAGNGTVVNAAGATWISNATATSSNFILASNQGAGDTGAGAVFTNQGTFNKQGAAITEVRTAFNNTGAINVQAGQLQFGTGGALTHNGALSIASGAILDFASGNTVTQTINTASTTIAGTLSITNDNFVNFTQAHTIGGTGTFLQNFGQVTGANLTLGPTLAFNITDGGHSGAATTTVQGIGTITGTGMRLDGGRIFRNEGTLTQTNANVDMNSRRSGSAEAGNGTVTNAVGGTWISNATATSSNFILASNQGAGDTGAGAVFTNQGTFNKQGAAITEVRTAFNNTGAINVQAGQLQFGTGGALTHNGALSIASGAILDFASGNTVTQTINTASTTIAGTLSITNDNFVNFTQAHTIGGTGTFLQNFGQVTGANLTLGPTLAFNITDGGHSGAATTTVQGIGTITGTGMRLDGGRIFRNEGTLTQTNANVDMNSRRSGSAEAGNGTVTNAVGGTWISNATATSSNFILASNQGAGDTGAGAVFTNQGTFNKQGAAITEVRTAFNNTGAINVQAGQLQFGTGGALTHNGALSIASGAILDFASGNTVTQTINTASTTIAGTLSITNDNFVNFTQAHTIGGTGTFLQNFGQVTGANLTLGPTLAFNITDGGHSGAATTTVQGIGTITGTGMRLDGGRIFRNEGTLTQTNANVDMNSRRSGSAEAGNGTVTNAVGGTWISNATATSSNFILASNQGAGDTGAGAVFTNQGTFNKQGAAITEVRTAFNNTGAINVQAGQLQFGTGGALTHNGALSIASGAILDFASGNTVTQTINTASTTIAGTLSITNDNFVNFTQAHTIGGTGTFLQNFGQVTGANLTLGPTLAFNITDGGHSGAATTTVQGIGTITGTGMRLDGGRIFRNEGTLTQTNANVDMNSRRSGSAEAGNGTVTNAVGGTWISNATATSSNFILASNQGAGDTGAGAVFTNQGTFNKQGAAITEVRTAFNNTGLTDVQAGQLRFTTNGTQGTGTLQTSGGILEIQGASTTGNLFHNTNTVNSLILGANTITVGSDYNNANFGVGNDFNRRANVSTTGTGARLLAGGDVNQGLSGVGISNGNTTTPAIVVGNVHVGATTYTYNINNTGTTGPVLRGAIQNAVNGGNITDARLSGNGVLSSNFGPIATGQSVSRDITITVGAAGVYAPISGQAVSIVNNFENTRSQLLTISSAAGAAAYNLAAGSVTPTPVVLANQRVGGSGSQSLTVSNTGSAGSFTEVLNASFGANTGSAINNGGSVSVAGGNSAAGFMTAGVNTSSAGAKSGTVVLNFVSDGNGSSGLGLTNVGSQIINVSGNVYNAAVGAATPSPISIANQRVGGAASQALTISNTAAAGGFSEALNASFSGTTGAATHNNQSIGNLAAGASELTAMTVGVNTSTAGAKAGTVTLAYQSDGAGTSGLAAIAAGTQVINVNGNVYQAATGALQTAPLNFGTVQVGQSVSQGLVVRNTASGAAGFVEDLNASFGSASGTGAGLISGSGSLSGILAGTNSSAANGAMTVNVNTAAAGVVNGNIAVNYFTAGAVNGVSNGLGTAAANSEFYGVAGTIQAVANVINQASPLINNPTINLGNVRVGAMSPTQAVSITNVATVAPQAALNATVSAAAPITASGSFNLLAPGGTNNSSIVVGMQTVNAGANSGTATVAFVSDANNVGNCAPNCQLNLASQNVAVTGNVYRLATGASTPTPVTFGNVRVGGSAQQFLTVTNTAVADGFSESLNAGFTGSTGSASSTSGNVVGLAAGASNINSLNVLLNTGTAGAKSGSVTVGYVSSGAGTSGLADIANGSQVISFSGNVYNAAAGNALSPVQVANQRVGGSNTAIVTVTNTAAAGSFSEDLNANVGASSGAASGSGSIAGRLAGASSGGGAITVGVDSSAAGARTGTVTLNYQSAGAVSGVSNGLGTLAVGSQVVTVNGNVYQAATGALQTAPLNFGTVQVGQSVSQGLVVRNTASGAAGFVEDLNASFGSASGTGAGLISGSGSLSGILAGTNSSAANGAMTVNVNTAAAGVVNGNIAVNYFTAGAVNGVSNGLGTAAANSEFYGVAGTIQAVANVINQASPLINNPTINLGNVRVGAMSPTQAVSITNVATVAPQAALNATVSAAAPITASGSFNLLAPGGTNNSSIVVGMQTVNAGANSGTATVAFVSDANNVGNCAPNCQFNLASQNVTVNGAVYNAAVGSATPTPVVIVNQRVGGTGSQVLSVANTAASGAFSEALNASFSGATGMATNNSGSVSNLISGGVNATSMGVGVNTTSAGAKTGTVMLAYQTDGTGPNGNSGLAAISAGSQLINVSGNVYQAASGALQTAPLNFGTLQVGQVINQNLVVRNTASGAAGFVEDLNAAFGSSGNSQITGAGTLSGITAGNNSTAGNGSMTVTVTGATAGALNSSIGVNYFSAGAVGGVGNGLGTLAAGSENYAVNGTISAVGNVINQASPLVNTPSINLGAVRVGAAAPSATVSVSNVAGAPPQAALNASIASGGAPVTASGSFNLLNPGGTNSTSLQVGLNTGTAGNFTGANAGKATISLVSDASNVGGCEPNCQLNLASQSVSVQGKVYTQAVGQLATGAVDFGIVRVGDKVGARDITVQNTAALTALNDTLRADLSGISRPFSSGNSVAGVGAQGSGNITVALDTLKAGIFNQTGSVAFLSQNPDMADISAGANGSVQVKAQVNNLANADFDLLAGIGVLQQFGNAYVLDLGNIVIGSLINELLQLENEVAGPADALRGMFNLTAANDFKLSGWNEFKDLEAGSASGGLSVTFNADNLGQFEDMIAFDGSSYNASDPTGLAQSRSLLIRANVVDGTSTVPEPGSAALAVLAMLSMWLVRRRQHRSPVHRSAQC